MPGIAFIVAILNIFGANGYFSRRTNFLVEQNRRISDVTSLLIGSFVTRSNVECSVFCETNLRCKNAEFDKGTLVCRLYEGSSLFVETTTATGSNVIKGNMSPFRMKFDPSTKHGSVYLSHDLQTLTDHPTSSSASIPVGPSSLRTYRGVIADNCIPSQKVVFFAVNYDYSLDTKTLMGTQIIFEIGLAERNRIDNGLYAGTVGAGGWAFPVEKCMGRNEICLEAWHNDFKTFGITWSPNTIGLRKTGNFYAILNRKNNTFTLRDGSGFITQFTGVMSNVDLCPVFSVHGNTVLGFKSSMHLYDVRGIA